MSSTLPIKQKTFGQEIKTLLLLALPVCLGQLAGLSMTFVDTVMAGRAGAINMAAVAIASSFWVPVTLFGQGLLMAITPLVAQAFAAGKEEGIGTFMRQGIWLALALSSVLLVVLACLAFFLRTLSIDPELVRLASNYLFVMLIGLPALMVFVVQRYFLEGLGQTRPTMFIGFLGLAINIPLNYIFIFGKFGMPALGAVGCAVASAAVCWSMCFAVTFFVKKARPKAYRYEKPNFTLIRRVFNIGFPNALAMLIETSVFAIVAIVIAPLGTLIVAGHQVALNVTSMFFMIPLSLSIVTSIRVGNTLGERNMEGTKTVRKAAITLAACVGIFNAGMILLFREHIAHLYSSDASVIPLAMFFLSFAAIFQIVDSLQVSFIGVLRGYNDTKAILAITFFVYWCLGFPFGYVLAMTSWLTPVPMGAQGFWIGMVICLFLAAIMLGLRTRHLEQQSEEKIINKIER